MGCGSHTGERSCFASERESRSELKSEAGRRAEAKKRKMVTFTKHSSLVRRVSKCFNDPSVCDVTVYGPSNDVYHCLRFNLCLSSEIFRQMLSGENSKELHVHEVDTEALGHLLKFLHTGECDMTDENIIPLAAAAEMYEVHELVDLCSNYKKNHLKINERNCCYLLEDATDFGARDIAEECQEFITRNMELICARTEFLLLDFEIVQGVGVHAEENLFRSQEEGAGHLCMWVVLGLIKWMERDLPHREVLKMDLLWNLDLAPLSPEQISRICRCDIIRRSPELSMSVIDALACMSEKVPSRNSYPGTKMKTFQSQGKWEKWTVETSGWYTVVAKDGLDQKPSCMKVYKGLSCKIEGGASSGGGAFYFSRGDEVRVITGTVPSPSCMIVKSARTGQDQMVMVAGGDLNMAFTGDEQDCKEAGVAAVDRSALDMEMVPSGHAGPLVLYDEYADAQQMAATIHQDMKHQQYVQDFDALSLKEGSAQCNAPRHVNAVHHRQLSLTPHTSDVWEENLVLEEPSFKIIPPKPVAQPLVQPQSQEQSVKKQKKSKKKIFPRMDSTKVRRKWKRFMEVVRS